MPPHEGEISTEQLPDILQDLERVAFRLRGSKRFFVFSPSPLEGEGLGVRGNGEAEKQKPHLCSHLA